jgi:peptidoglycan/xylan/chitin deacetylase (PgdA/CDA1 family)
MKRFFKSASVASLILMTLMMPSVTGASPVLLTFDVETPTDGESLAKLSPGVPATYFITGEFAEKHKELVSSLSGSGNTIGSHSYSHPHFRAIDDSAVMNDIARSKHTLESITGKPVVWFRSPYLEYDRRTLRTLNSLGFTGDSSDKETWEAQTLLDEIPVSNYKNEDLIASDYDMIDEDHFTEEAYEAALRKLYLEKEPSGQPVVILSHPAVSVKYPDVLKRFVRFVEDRHGSFLTFDSYSALMKKNGFPRTAAWTEPGRNIREAKRMAASLAASKATDVFIRTGYDQCSGTQAVMLDRTIAQLKSKGLKVHAWISPLIDSRAVAKHPDWAMCAKNGDRSADLLSPANPEAVDSIVNSTLKLLGRHRFDGICLDNLAYPNDEYDYSPRIRSDFARANGIDHLPALGDLLNGRYNHWINWRSNVISQLAASVSKAVHKRWGSSRECSAIISGISAIDFHARETSGQNLDVFAESLDFLLPAIALPALNDVSEPAGRLRRELFALHIRAGKRPLMITQGICPASFEHTPATAGNSSTSPSK